MLEHVRGAQTVQARIEELELGRRLPCVLLASNLVNTSSDAQRAGFLDACARHLEPDGVVLIERHEPGWTPAEGVRGTLGEVTIALEDVRVDSQLVTATVRYEAAGRRWRHPFNARILDDAELDALWPTPACDAPGSSTSVASGSRPGPHVRSTTAELREERRRAGHPPLGHRRKGIHADDDSAC